MFSIGNLITLLVVVAILFVYRHLDTRRRSLEKVKRYADRVAKGVAQSIDRKAAEVQDLAIELQVNLKTGAELLKRARSVAEGLAERAAEADRLGERLQAHDAAVTQLAGRTQSVEESLRKVESECAAIPTLKEHLAGVRGDASSLQRQVLGAAASVADLDKRISGLLTQREELRGIHGELARTRAAGDDIVQKVARLQEQRKDVEALADTVGGLEHDVGRLQPGVDEVRENVAKLQHQVQALAAGSDRAEAALRSLHRIDAAMAEAERRAERLQVAREWLARTETRLAQIGAGAQEQVRLLEALLREGRGATAAERGAVTLDKRETVLKLSGQGWSVPEIARATKLSRGEVELILEVGATVPAASPESGSAAENGDQAPVARSIGATPSATAC